MPVPVGVTVTTDVAVRVEVGVSVPAWTYGDYDSIYVVRVNYATGTPQAQFHKTTEGLNGQPTSCPS